MAGTELYTEWHIYWYENSGSEKRMFWSDATDGPTAKLYLAELRVKYPERRFEVVRTAVFKTDETLGW